MGNQVDVTSLVDEARSAIAEGLRVIVIRLPTSLPLNDARHLLEWSRSISAIEEHGWMLQTLTIGQDHAIGVQDYLLFRRTPSGDLTASSPG